jgi:hypothetical protein
MLFAAKIQCAIKLIEHWQAYRSTREPVAGVGGTPWKRWVCQQPKGKAISLTPRFLTRAVNNGELKEPVKER